MRLLLVSILMLGAFAGARGERKHINTPVHPKGLPFSDAVLVDDTLYCSGNIGADAKGNVPADFSEEARQALKNLGTVLQTAGLDYGDVVKVNVFLADMSRFEEWNKVYQEFFKSDLPARSTVGVSALARGAKLEVEMIAVKKK